MKGNAITVLPASAGSQLISFRSRQSGTVDDRDEERGRADASIHSPFGFDWAGGFAGFWMEGYFHVRDHMEKPDSTGLVPVATNHVTSYLVLHNFLSLGYGVLR